MILDALLSFTTVGTPQAITATAVSANTLDMSVARDMGVGGNYPLRLSNMITTTFTSGGAGTLQLQLQASVDNATWVVLAESRAFALAELVAGRKLFPIDLPARGDNEMTGNPRYYRMNYINGTAVFTAGAIDSKLVLDRQDWGTYPAGVVISN